MCIFGHIVNVHHNVQVCHLSLNRQLISSILNIYVCFLKWLGYGRYFCMLFGGCELLSSSTPGRIGQHTMPLEGELHIIHCKVVFYSITTYDITFWNVFKHTWVLYLHARYIFSLSCFTDRLLQAEDSFLISVHGRSCRLDLLGRVLE